MATGQQGYTTTTSTTLTQDIRAYLAKKTLDVAKSYLKFYNLAGKYPISAGEGAIFKAVRYEKLALALTPLTEGYTPAGNSMTITPVTATCDQWGDFVTITDVADLIITHPAVQKATDLIGIEAGELYDREIQDVLAGATNVYYSYTNYNAITSSYPITTALVQSAVAGLQSNGAMYYDGNNYMGVVDPQVQMDFITNDKFLLAAQYQNIKALQEGEIGTWMGVRWVMSNFVAKAKGIAAPSATPTTGGSLSQSTAYSVQVVGKDINTGFPTLVSALEVISSGTMSTNTAISVTMPSTAGYVYDVYLGVPGSVNLTTSINNAASAVVTILTVGTGEGQLPIPATGSTVHNAWIFGKEAYGVAELSDIEILVTPKGPTDSDPLAQRRHIGFKFFAKAVILNNNYMALINCGSAFDPTTPVYP